jgi:hypothetical protein
MLEKAAPSLGVICPSAIASVTAAIPSIASPAKFSGGTSILTDRSFFADELCFLSSKERVRDRRRSVFGAWRATGIALGKGSAPRKLRVFTRSVFLSHLVFHGEILYLFTDRRALRAPTEFLASHQHLLTGRFLPAIF